MNRPSDATRAALKTLAAAALLATAADEAAADVRFEPELVVGAAYSDNIELAAADAEDEVAVQFRPGLRAIYDGPRIVANVAYGLEHYSFANESDRDATYHQFDGLATLEAIPETVFIDVQGLYAQTLVDPLATVGYSNIISTTNRADFFARSVTPRVMRDIGRHMRFDAEYRLGYLDYENVPELAAAGNLDDLENRALRATLGSPSTDDTFVWALRFYDETVEFDTAARAEYRTAEGRVGFRLVPTLQLIGAGGRESDVREDQTRASLDASMWNAGVRWEPSDRVAVEATTGERWFGPTYALDARLEGRRVDAGAAYTETSLTVGQQLFRRPVLRSAEPTDPQGGLGRNTTDVYLSKSGNAWIGLTGRRNRIRLDTYDDRRTFLASDQLETERGVRTLWMHAIGPRTSVTTEAVWQRVGYIATTRNDEFMIGTLTIRRQLGARSELELTGRHSRRTSDEAPVSPLYEENSVALLFRWSLQPLQREDRTGGAGRADASARDDQRGR